MLTVAALKNILAGIPEEVDAPCGQVPVYVMVREGCPKLPTGEHMYAHCHIVYGSDKSMLTIIPDEPLTNQNGLMFERFNTKGDDKHENPDESKLGSSYR